MFRGSLAFLLTALLLVACGPPPDHTGGGGGGATGGGGGGSNGGGSGGGGGGTGGGGGGTSCGGDTWTNYASTWFHDNCANCHSSEFGSYLAVTQSKSSIDGRIAASSMPPGGLDTGDRQRILSWFSCDMPQ